MKRPLIKIVSLLLIFAFSVNSVCYGLATLPASQNPIIKREILAALQRTQIRYAESEDALRLLNTNNASCLLLSSGKYLITKEIAQDDLRLLRAIIHEDIEAIMQILSTEDRYKYQAIKELILNYFPPPADNKLPIDLYVNHTVARAFDWLILLYDKIIMADEIPKAEKDFLKIFSSRVANRRNYFTAEFWDSRVRGERIRLALAGGMRFYQTANTKKKGYIATKDVVGRFLEENKDFEEIAPKKTLKELYSADEQKRVNSFADLCDGSDERLAPLLMSRLIEDLEQEDPKGFITDAAILRGGLVTSLTTPTKINIFNALIGELRKNNSVLAKDILEDLKSNDTVPAESIIKKMQNLQNMGIFQPLLDAMGDTRAVAYHDTFGDVVKEFFKAILFKLADKTEIEKFLKERPVIWKPDGMPTWDGRDCVEGEDECWESRKAAEKYLITAYRLAPYLNKDQAEVLEERLKVIENGAVDFKYYAGGAHRNEDWYSEFSYVHIRDLIKKTRMRSVYLLKEGGAVKKSADYRALGLIDLDKLRMGDTVGNKAKSFVIFEELELDYPDGIAATIPIVRSILEGNEEAVDMVVNRAMEYFDIIEKTKPFKIKEKRRDGISNYLPIELAVRSSPNVSMPGILETVLGVTDKEALKQAVKKVAASWNSDKAKAYHRANNISDEPDLGIVIQRVVGNNRSIEGVIFSKNPDTGEKGLYGRYIKRRKTDKDNTTNNSATVVSGKEPGRPISELKQDELYGEVYEKLEKALEELEKRLGYPQEVEFVSTGLFGRQVYFLQTRDIRFSPTQEIEILKSRLKEDPRTLMRLEAFQTRMQKRRLYRFDPHGKAFKPLFESSTFIPGTMAGYLAFSAEKAMELAKKGKAVILVETPEMKEAIESICSINDIGLISKGYRNAVCHGAVLARGEGIPCVIDPPDVEIKGTRLIYGQNIALNEGDLVLISDGKVYGNIFDKQHDEKYYLVEMDKSEFEPFRVDISKYRTEFRSKYIAEDESINISYEELLDLNARWAARLKESLLSSDEESIYRLNLEKHFLHELLFEKGKYMGKTESNINIEIAHCLISYRKRAETKKYDWIIGFYNYTDRELGRHYEEFYKKTKQLEDVFTKFGIPLSVIQTESDRRRHHDGSDTNTITVSLMFTEEQKTDILKALREVFPQGIPKACHPMANRDTKTTDVDIFSDAAETRPIYLGNYLEVDFYVREDGEYLANQLSRLRSALEKEGFDRNLVETKTVDSGMNHNFLWFERIGAYLNFPGNDTDRSKREKVLSILYTIFPELQKPKDLSRGHIDEAGETHPALDTAANEGRMLAITLAQAGKLQQLSNEELADLLIANLIHLRSPPKIKQKLLGRLKDASFRQNLIKGFTLMSESVKSEPLPQDKPVRLCIVMEDKDLPTIVFKDPYNNLIAHSGRGQKTDTPYTSIYAGYDALKTAIDNKQEDDFKKIIAHEARDVIRGYHIDEEKEEVTTLYNDTLDIYDAGEFKTLWFDVLDKPFQEGSIYKIKYDTSRLSSSQIAVIKEYVRLLNEKTQSRFETVGCSSLNGSKETLITVYRQDKAGNAIGKGCVDIGIPKGDSIEQYALRITGMLNIALAASNIGENPSGENESPLTGFIRRQCRLIIDDSVTIPENIVDLIKFIRNLPLPKASRMPTEKIEEYNRLAKQALTAA